MKKENLALITDLRHELHAHPELSLREEKTRQRLMQFLRDHTDLEITDRGSWFYAFYDCGLPEAGAIAFRADMDALPIPEDSDIPYCSENPGVSHRCGHDGHSSVLAGLALEVAGRGADKNVYFIFQHAEEVGAGGADCAELIREKDISAVYAFHNWSGFPFKSVVTRSGVIQCASRGLTVRFKGVTTHASQPEYGINPARAVAELLDYLIEAPGKLPHEGLLMATVVHALLGARNFGIAASEGEVSATLRAYREEDLDCLLNGIRNKALSLAGEDGLSVSFEDSDVFPETVNDPVCVEKVIRAAEANGHEVVILKDPIRGSEDFGHYQKLCPGAIFYVGNGEDYPALHTIEYDFNDGILGCTVDLFLSILEEDLP